MQDTSFGEILKELIDERELDFKRFAEATAINASCITQYVHNATLPTVKNLIIIADYFNCSTDFLLGKEPYDDKLTFKPCPPFGEQILFLLKYYQCTSTDFYTANGITKSRFFDWKSGRRQPSVDNILKLAKHFNCRVDFILGRES